MFQKFRPFLIYVLKAFHISDDIFVTLKLLCNTFWSMSQQMLKNNQRVVRDPPIFPFKLEQSDTKHILDRYYISIFLNKGENVRSNKHEYKGTFCEESPQSWCNHQVQKQLWKLNPRYECLVPTDFHW